MCLFYKKDPYKGDAKYNGKERILPYKSLQFTDCHLFDKHLTRHPGTMLNIRQFIHNKVPVSLISSRNR